MIGSRFSCLLGPWIVMAALCVALIACSAPEGPSPDGVLRRGMTNEPDTLDPHFSRQTEMASLLGDLYEGLLVMSPQGGLQPGVAESWTVSKDGLRYTFRLRPEARWSDGSPLSAQVFVDSFRRVVDPATASPHAGMLTSIVGASAITAGEARPDTLGVRAINDHELRIELAYPAPYFLSVLTHGATLPVHMPSLTQYGREFTRPGRLISNGAYTLAQRADREFVELAKNPRYWNSGQIMIERVRYIPYESESAQFSAYRAGQLDMTDIVPNGAMERVTDSYSSEFVARPTKDTFYYGFNLRAGALRDAVGPHVARLLLGEDQRFFLPGALLSGATILSATSVLSKVLLPGAVLPIGVITALVGVPFFMVLILTKGRKSW